MSFFVSYSAIISLVEYFFILSTNALKSSLFCIKLVYALLIVSFNVITSCRYYTTKQTFEKRLEIFYFCSIIDEWSKRGFMKIEKLPSGSYRVRMTFNGKRQSVVFDHKPTESEVMLKFSEKVSTVIDCKHITFEVASNEYCKLKKNVLSPTTYREYSKTCDRLSKDFINLYIDQISALHIQSEINLLSADKKPKTVKNYYNFIVTVIRMYREDFYPKVKLPEGQKSKPYIPTDTEVKKLFEYAKTESNGMYYVPIVLASYGMRRSEICALNPEDIKDNVVYINKAKVLNVDKEWIIKDYPKNETSIRQIPIPEEIAKIINQQGYVYNGHPNSIYKVINRFCKLNNIEHFSIHKLRHYFCSRLSSENIDVESIISLSGHKTDYVMKTIYRHAINEKVQEASNRLNDILFG